MELRESQKLLVEGMRHSAVPVEETAIIVSVLKTEKRELMMLDWMNRYLKEEEVFPPQDQILAAVEKIEELEPLQKAERENQS